MADNEPAKDAREMAEGSYWMISTYPNLANDDPLRRAYFAGVHDAAARLARAPSPSGEGLWTSVKDDLPRLGQKIILLSNGVVQEETYSLDRGDEGGDFWARDELDKCPPVQPEDYWKPLPKPPAALLSSPAIGAEGHICSTCQVRHGIRQSPTPDNPRKTDWCVICKHRAEGITIKTRPAESPSGAGEVK
jgi:hypothetical protein